MPTIAIRAVITDDEKKQLKSGFGRKSGLILILMPAGSGRQVLVVVGVGLGMGCLKLMASMCWHTVFPMNSWWGPYLKVIR
jgi:hypothetical protein